MCFPPKNGFPCNSNYFDPSEPTKLLFDPFWAILSNILPILGPSGSILGVQNPFHGFKQISLDASTPIIFCSCNLNCFDPSEAKKCFFEPFLGYFLAIWGKFGHLGIYFGDVRNPLIGPVRLDWMSLGEKWVPMHCNVPEFCVLSPSAGSFLAPKIITQIGSCGAKISHGYDLGAFIPA